MFSGRSSMRLQRAKSEVSHRRPSIDSMKSEFRNRFFNKLRISRSKSVDRFRLIVESTGFDYKSLHELRHILLADKEAIDLINTDEVNALLIEVENEMREVSLEYEVEKIDNESQKETEDTVKRLMTPCEVCQMLSVDIICPQCSTQLHSEFQ